MKIDRNVNVNVTVRSIQVSKSNGRKNFSYGVYISAGVTNIRKFIFSKTWDAKIYDVAANCKLMASKYTSGNFVVPVIENKLIFF